MDFCTYRGFHISTANEKSPICKTPQVPKLIQDRFFVCLAKSVVF